eukprot:NODE_88_length_21789_cov_0.534440.p15 type:complete len:152 gc:universal NODE_88_length_21789_cov_0.534440:18065-17610(-)
MFGKYFSLHHAVSRVFNCTTLFILCLIKRIQLLYIRVSKSKFSTEEKSYFVQFCDPGNFSLNRVKYFNIFQSLRFIHSPNNVSKFKERATEFCSQSRTIFLRIKHKLFVYCSYNIVKSTSIRINIIPCFKIKMMKVNFYIKWNMDRDVDIH